MASILICSTANDHAGDVQVGHVNDEQVDESVAQLRDKNPQNVWGHNANDDQVNWRDIQGHDLINDVQVNTDAPASDQDWTDVQFSTAAHANNQDWLLMNPMPDIQIFTEDNPMPDEPFDHNNNGMLTISQEQNITNDQINNNQLEPDKIPSKFKCDVCTHKARDLFNLKRHVESVHSETQVECSKTF